MRSKEAVRGGFVLAAALMLLLTGWIGPGNTALAADCGPAVGGVAACVAPGLNPYVGGIIYGPLGGHTLNVEGGIIVNRAPGHDANGIQVRDELGGPVTVNLAPGVIITTNGLNADGVEVLGIGDVIINSAANITVDAGVSDTSGTGGLFGWIRNVGSIGNIYLNQLAGSTITVTQDDAFGLYGLNEGTGSIVVTSSGNISTAGLYAYGLNAWNREPGVGADTTATLNALGSIVTDGENATAVYSLNAGKGNALAQVAGKVRTLQYGADGVLADIDNQLMSGTGTVVIADTADIYTIGELARGGWVLNWGLGNAAVVSAGTVRTDGKDSYGLQAQIRYDPISRPRAFRSSADAWVYLEGNGTVLTNGVAAHALFADNQGYGDATVTMASGTSVTTTGNLANGANAKSLGTASFTQATGAPITVSGAEAFGVNLLGATLASANINGIVTATGRYGVGASSNATTGISTVAIAPNAIVMGGWQADVAGLGATTIRPSAGVLLGSGMSSQLTNLGTIGAGSDRAIADIGRQTATPGNLTVDNGGLVTGFVELAGLGTNVFNNATQFDVRHFADTNGDFTRDTKRVSISDFGAPTSSFNNLAGATVRLAPVLGETVIDAASYYVPTTGIDSRPLEASYYALGRTGVVQGQFTNLGTFHNAGIIDLRGSATGNTLVMTGNAAAGGAAGNGVFISDGGQLLLNSVLNEGVAAGGQTGSFSDVLVVDSTQMGTGPTTITIDRREGAGAGTPGNGILLVEVRNKAASAPGVFALNGDFIANGAQAVVQGAYYYNLYHNGVAGDAADGNWYLRNLGLSPNVPVYEEYPKVLEPLIEVPTLQQRVGNRFWLDPAPVREPQTVFCKDPARNFRCTVTDEQAAYYLDDAGTATVDGTGLWGRIEAARAHSGSPLSVSGAVTDSNIWRLQAGVDSVLQQNDAGALVGGLNVQYGHVGASIVAPGAAGSINTTGYGLGGTLTWHGSNGFYADAQAQVNWFSSDLASTTLGRALATDNKGFGYAVSLEAGQRVALNANWALTPQAQLTYSGFNFDSFTDPFGTTVSLLSGESLTGRLGLAAEYQSSWKDQNGETARLSAYGVANLYNEFLDDPQVDIAGVKVASRNDRLWGGLGLGGSYEWGDGKYALHGEISTRTSLENFGDSYQAAATLGLRVKW